jgi:hypothetical protein
MMRKRCGARWSRIGRLTIFGRGRCITRAAGRDDRGRAGGGPAARPARSGSVGSMCGSGRRVTTIRGLHSSWLRFINGLVEAQGWLGWWGCTQPLARKCQGLPISVEVIEGSPPSPPSRDHFPPGNPAVRAVCAPQCHRAHAHVAMRSEPIAESPGVELAAAKRRQLDCLP